MKSQMPRFRFRDPNAEPKNRKKDFRKIQEKRKRKKETDEGEIGQLSKRLWPTSEEKKEDIQPADIKTFTELPISKKTLKGLDNMRFSKPTDIQRESLMYALKGHDILGAAKTGSGKTLAFLIPILETLFRQRYTPSFGMAALVISPTRELAYQSYDVLRKIGKFHAFSFGLAIGGMFLREEAKKMYTTNVVICTPGRLLQHFEQTPNFTADELKVLVLDEADKILDLGFAETLNSIVEALPKQRQTLLFSATQTKSIKSLARLSLKKPIYVSVHEKAKEVTPTTLNQRYIVCDQQSKVNLLWSFIKSHKMKKMLVFLSSCKEVRYLYQVFKKMHPGLTILCLHGHMKQLQRMEAYELFSRKKNVVMLATDVAARGLDFPVIHWVVQVDKPENTDTYIHRVGRTARYEQVGEALLMLMPSEEKKMVEDLTKRKIPIVKLKVAKKRTFDITKKLENFCASDQDLKSNAQKAFISVMKTLYVLDKATFHQVDVDAYAASLGLVQAPKLPFLAKTKTEKKADEDGGSSDEDDDNDEDESDEEAAMRKRLQAGKKKTLDFSLGDNEGEEEEDSDIYNVVKASKAHLQDDEKEKEELQLVEEGKWTSKKKSSYKQKLKMLKQSKLITFDEEGNPEGEEEKDEDGEQGLDISKAVERLRKQDKIDKEVQRQRIKMEHREKRLKEKQKRREEQMAKMGLAPEEGTAVLGNPDGDDNDNDENPDYGDDDDDDDDNDGENSSNDEEDESDHGDESDDEGPQTKRRKMNNEERSDDEEDEDSANDDEDEDNSNEEDMEEEDDDDDEDDGEEEEDDEDEGSPENVEQDEAAVLALLGGGKR